METSLLIKELEIIKDNQDKEHETEILYQAIKKLEKLEKWEMHYFKENVLQADFSNRTPLELA